MISEMSSMLEYLVARVYSEAAGSKQSQGGGGNTFLRKASFGIPFWTVTFVVL